ncbi:MAG: D-glycero-beta-D-manno-heptose 1-phosphate adenylyltransferase [Candidatus Cloacimonadales bacterium]|jgi:D-beta-D-heptose 7-phosphate kinase/D-beta-D-heptose 1-phosphate adenosyltransferase|nr:D-glycero-beta-D-manno-heptose 1-phosphate adenylyltransferase [Candidatus Cloacimonadota bacterium]MDD2649747.1 D-glycero-beta-D-manno-heptose 1-phosphate adenylyltransferase [Candidatus Cloacimonadota bacterium]MDX9977581.1 D-glycero-beta-D-manno-heptose 1-phosphate adenylyltransferase [Candidatus Cloacimonadales bacterium]
MSCIEKIKKLDELVDLRNKLYGNKIVFTNGCFDIIHSGHVIYLEEAKSLGDVLILGLNSDTSVKRLKGENRPINNQNDRAIVLSGLSSVDYVVIFEKDDPYDIIHALQPDVLVKGGDWKIEDIIGSDIVLEKGGEVISLSFIEGKSTTNIIKKVVQNGTP